MYKFCYYVYLLAAATVFPTPEDDGPGTGEEERERRRVPPEGPAAGVLEAEDGLPGGRLGDPGSAGWPLCLLDFLCPPAGSEK